MTAIELERQVQAVARARLRAHRQRAPYRVAIALVLALAGIGGGYIAIDQGVETVQITRRMLSDPNAARGVAAIRGLNAYCEDLKLPLSMTIAAEIFTWVRAAEYQAAKTEMQGLLRQSGPFTAIAWPIACTLARSAFKSLERARHNGW
jgi:hypothetical protein